MARKNKGRNRFDFLTKNFPKRMQKKLVGLFIAVILAFVVLVGRITYINASNGSDYTKIVLDQQTYDSRSIAYKRGDIVDRNGTKLATSERVYNVVLDSYVLLSDEDYLEPTLTALENCFGLDRETIRSVAEENPDSRYEVIAKQVSYETAQSFESILEDDEANPDVKGIWLEEDYERVYPYNTLACDVIGFTNAGNEGALGIESAYNDILNGTDGREYGYFSDTSSAEQTVKAARNGDTVVSTIDMVLQNMVEQCILEFNQEYANFARPGTGSTNTAVIVMDPNSGEILAEANYPDFNLNSPRDLSAYYDETTWDAMPEEEQLDAMNEIWRNFCVSDAFEPGSTFKPFTVAAGLETGTITGNEVYHCEGYKHVGDYDIYCAHKTGHGDMTVADALAYSCNVSLMNISETIGIENFSKYQRVFGFGQYTGIDLPGEADTSTLLYTTEEMQVTDLATNAFGQNFNVTMTQMISAFSSLINGGSYYEPHIVKQIQDEDGNIVETRDPVLLRKTISKETSDQIREYLKGVMSYGTGTPANVEGYDIGGKTGTAEKLPRDDGNYLLSYIGYAPQDDPQVVVYVVIDEPNVPDQSNSDYVLQLAQKIMAQIFPYLKIPATAVEVVSEDITPVEEEYSDYDAAYEETYSNEAGWYYDESYSPDYADWVGTGYADD